MYWHIVQGNLGELWTEAALHGTEDTVFPTLFKPKSVIPSHQYPATERAKGRCFNDLRCQSEKPSIP